MNLTISRPIRIFALVGLIALLGGAAMLMLRKPSATSDYVPAPTRTATTAHLTTPATHVSKPAVHVAKPKPVVHKAKPAPAPAPAKPVTHAKLLVAPNGLPMVLFQALRHHRIVVVSLFDPDSSTDAIAFAEARAGAAAAGVGFLGVSLLNNDVAAPLTSSLGGTSLLPEPGLLIYRRPGKLIQRIDGFADRSAVAQAAVSARTAPPLGHSGP